MQKQHLDSRVPPPQSASTNSEPAATMDDNFADYRKFCANRMRRLERYKKAKSLCSFDDEACSAKALMQPSGSISALGSDSGSHSSTFQAVTLRQTRATIDTVPLSPSLSLSPSSVSPALREYNGCNPPHVTSDNRPISICSSEPCSECPVATPKFDLLREKMISLMENDVRLLQQLLALGDSIQDLKTTKGPLGGSQMSLNSLDEQEDAWPAGKLDAFSSSLTAVTNLYVDDEPKQNIQYFSRKNSVLRIPIPPRSSNRMCANKQIPRRLSDLSRASRRIHISDHHHHHHLEQSCHGHHGDSRDSTLRSHQTFVSSTITRLSNGSIDSGIRDEIPSSASSSSPSPTFVQSN